MTCTFFCYAQRYVEITLSLIGFKNDMLKNLRYISLLAMLILTTAIPSFAGSWQITYTSQGTWTGHTSRGDASGQWLNPPVSVNGALPTVMYGALWIDYGTRMNTDPPGDSIKCSGTAQATLTWVPTAGDVPGQTVTVIEKSSVGTESDYDDNGGNYDGSILVPFTGTASDGLGDPLVPVSGSDELLSSGSYARAIPVVLSNGQYTATLPVRNFSASATSTGNGFNSHSWLHLPIEYMVSAPPPLLLWDAAKSWSTHIDFSDGNIGNITPQAIAAQEAKTPFKPVVAAAADGASKILLEFDSTSSAPVTFNAYGPGSSLYAIPGGTQSVPVLKSNGLYASYAVYSAPDVNVAFPTWGMMSNSVSFSGSNGTGVDAQSLALKRVPVVLVHGIWGNGASWNTSVGVMASLGSAGFDVRAVDYQSTNHSSFETNKDAPLNRRGGIQSAINSYRAKQWAVSKADVITHSMGGLVTRYFISQPEYVSVDNYYKGYIHRLITVGTPNLGSPEPQAYYWFYLEFYNNRLDLTAEKYLQVARLAPGPPGLGLRDCAPDSKASQRIYSRAAPANVPAFAEVGNAAAFGDFVSRFIQLFLNEDPFLLIQGGGGSVFCDANQTDTIISCVSQQGALPDAYSNTTTNTVHAALPGVILDDEQGSPIIGDHIVQQLWSDNFFTSGFPAPPLSDPNDCLSLPQLDDPFPTMMVDPGGLAIPQPLPLPPSTISVSSPTTAQMFSPGDTIAVTLTPNAGTTIASAAIGISSSDGTLSSTQAITAAPYTATFTIPQTTLGNVTIAMAATDTAGNISQTNTNVVVQTSATLQSLTAVPSTSVSEPITLTGVGETEQLQVSGAFSDGVTRDVASYQTQYASSNASVVTVSSTGLLTAVGNGTAQITVTNGNITSSFPVTVNVQIPQILATQPLGAGAGQTVALRLDGTNLGGASSIQFLTPAGQPDPNVTVSGVTLSPDGYMLTANVVIAQNCPAEQDTVVVTAAGSASDPLASGDRAVFTVLPPANTLSLSSSTATGVQTIQGTLLLSAPVPDGAGLTVTLSSSDPSVTIPASVTLYPGDISATFPITTSQVQSQTPVTITATASGVSATASFTETH